MKVKSLLFSVTLLVIAVFLGFVGVSRAFTGPTDDPPGGSSAIQVDPSTPKPSLRINADGQIDIGVWQGTLIGTLYGGTGCSGATPADVRTCLGAAASGANSDIYSLSPPPSGTPSVPTNLLLNPSGFVAIGTGEATPTAALSVGNISGLVIPFEVNSTGNITKINNVIYSWPATQGLTGTFLSNNGLGTLSWTTPAVGGSIGGWTEDSATNSIYTTTLGRLVGVGIATPAEKLDVAGNINFSGDIKMNSERYVYSRVSFSDFFAGYQAGNINVTGSGNTGVGYQALSLVTTGSVNTSAGYQSLKVNTTGSENTAIGSLALSANNSGFSNTAVGERALAGTTAGSENTALGASAGITNILGTGNTFIGAEADATSPNLTNATAIGYKAKVAQSNSIVFGQTGASQPKVGIATTTPLEILSVGPNSNFRVDISGNIDAIMNVPYTWPTLPGAPTSVLTNDGSGVLSWALPPGGSGVPVNGWVDDPVTASIHTSVASRPVAIGTPTPATGGVMLTVKRSSPGTALAIQDSSENNNFTISDTGEVTAGSVPWLRLSGFPAACGTGQFITTLGSTPTCAAPSTLTGGWAEDAANNKIYAVTDTRNVGIGTSTPLTKLHVVGNTFIEGNVGIGTLTPASKLTVAGLIHSANSGGFPSTAGGFVFPDGSIQDSAATVTGSGTNNYILKWLTSSTVGTSPLYDNGLGNIGLGTTDPATKLDVVGTVTVNSNSSFAITPTSSQPAAVFAVSNAPSNTTLAGPGTVTAYTYSTSSGSAAIYGGVMSGSSAAGIVIDQAGTGDIAQFKDSGTNVVVIKNGGNVGIGTGSSTVGAKLEVVNNTDDTIRMTKTAGTAGSVNMFAAVGTGTGTALCQALSSSAVCLGNWTSTGTLSTCITSNTNGRALCTGFGN